MTKTICNATRDEADKITSRLPGYRIVEPIATPGYSAEENRSAGLVGISPAGGLHAGQGNDAASRGGTGGHAYTCRENGLDCTAGPSGFNSHR